MTQDRVAIFWDYDSCNIDPGISGHQLVERLRILAHQYGGINTINAYMDASTQISPTAHSELQTSGVSLKKSYSEGETNTYEQMLLVDMLAYAIDNPIPSTIVLISCKPYLTYATSILRLRKYQVVIICPSISSLSLGLKTNASVCYDWHMQVTRQLNTPAAQEGSSSSVSEAQPRRASFSSSKLDPNLNTEASSPTPSHHQVPTASSSTSQETPGLVAQATAKPTFTVDSMLDASSDHGPNVANIFERRQKNASPTSWSGLLSATTIPSGSTLRASFLGSSGPFTPRESPPRSFGLSKVLNANRRSSDDVERKSSMSDIEQGYKTPRFVPPPTINNPAPASTWIYQTPNSNISFSAPPAFTCGVQNRSFSTSSSDIAGPSFSNPAHHRMSSGPSLLSGASFNGHRKSDDGIPAHFMFLASILEKSRKEGQARPLRSVVGLQLAEGSSTMTKQELYKRAGVDSFKQYAMLAEEKGIVILGGKDGYAWISLHPDWHGKVL